MKEFDPKYIVNEDYDKDESLDSYILSLMKELKKDTDCLNSIKHLNLLKSEVKNNIGKLNDYRLDFNVCKYCPGIDKCPKENKRTKAKIVRNGKILRLDYEPCDKAIEELKIDNYYICDDFPKEWKNSTLRQLDLSDTRKQLIKKYSSFIKGDSSSWLYIFGNHKVGKSFIAVTFANEYIRLFKKNVAVVSTPNLFRYLSDIYYKDKEKFNKIFDLLSNVDFLILDDFGNEYKNEFSRDNITIPLLSNRSNKELFTIFTSQFSIDEVRQLYSIGKVGGAIRGRQIESLLKTMCEKEFDLTGASLYRK